MESELETPTSPVPHSAAFSVRMVVRWVGVVLYWASTDGFI